MTRQERALFDKIKGELSIFRMGSCTRCGGETLAHKTFCSEECWKQQSAEGDDHGGS